MAEKILNTRIQLKGDSLKNWTTQNPVLKLNELAIVKIEESDKHELDSCNLEEVKDEFINGNPNLKNSAVNALQKVSFGMLPELEKLYNLLKEENFDFVQMTGSGSAIFCLTKNKKLANKMEEKYFKKGYQVELTKFLIN